MVLGDQRLEAALLIEPSTGCHMSVKDRAELLERVWPSIEAANVECPAHAKISKSLVMFTVPSKPMVRAGKGTIIRRATTELYADEITQLYSDADQLAGETKLTSLERDYAINYAESLQEYVRKAVLGVMGWGSMEQNEDFFSLGMDSLQALRLVREMRLICSIGPSTIYTNPTITLLAKVAAALASNDQVVRSSDTKAQHDLMDSFLMQYQEKINANKAARHVTDDDKMNEDTNARVVLLAGSTGALGAYILNSLLQTPSIMHIYCLNRSPNSDTVQSTRNKARQLPASFPASRVTFLTADLTINGTLGLSKETFTTLQSQVTHIIHNACTVDFNLNLFTFNPHLASVVNLIELAATSPQRPRVTFISSISSVQQWPSTDPVPESIIHDFGIPAANGYGRSKHLAERLFAQASEKLDLDVDIVRIG